jgi:hypothetical protein
LKAIRKQGNCRKKKSSSFEAKARNAEQKLWLLLHFYEVFLRMWYMAAGGQS